MITDSEFDGMSKEMILIINLKTRIFLLHFENLQSPFEPQFQVDITALVA